MLSFVDYVAMGLPSDARFGHLCDRGHKWNEMEITYRRWGKCVECEKERRDSESYKRTRQAWHEENHEEITAKARVRERERRQNGKVKQITDEQRQRRAEQKRLHRQDERAALQAKGLTARGTRPIRPTPLQTAIKKAGKLPTVAELVVMEQKKYWLQNTQARKEQLAKHHKDRQWLRYQTRHDLRLYHREKSKRRKAQMRGNGAGNVSVAAIAKRFSEFGNACAYCGNGGDMQIEHIVPVSKGGKHEIENIVPACASCNASKTNHNLIHWYTSQPFYSSHRLEMVMSVLLDKATT